jgi:hypothetical protein
VPQLQLSRAIRPAHLTRVIVVPGGAVNACPAWPKPAYVVPISRLLIPATSPEPLGHVLYERPAFPNGAHAELLWPKSPAASHDTTV